MKLAFSVLLMALGIVAAPSIAQNIESMTAAEVRRLDRAQNRITLRHEEIKHLEMPAMTMVFRVKDAAMLDRFKVGDKVRFSATEDKGAYFVTRIEPASP
ncbi:MAG: copper-binding protein [Betaproteobacteria bacterium]|nr:copper-binding protein [Betaproteobacteria bacterium]